MFVSFGRERKRTSARLKLGDKLLNNTELSKAVKTAMERQCSERGYAAPVDVLMELGVLPKKQYEAWRTGQVDYLEQVCTSNLSKLSFVMQQMRNIAREQKLKPSVCDYKQWGNSKKGRPGKLLRFSKSGNPKIEQEYATHYIHSERIAQLKAEKLKTAEEEHRILMLRF